jgi:hypothetical protein
MFKFFLATPVYIKILNNKIEIKDLRTGKSISRESSAHFSSTRLLIADFNVAELFIRSVLKELLSPQKIFQRSLKIVIQQMENLEGGLSESEKRILRDIGEQIGGVHVVLVDNTRPLSEAEALSKLKGH